MENMKMLTPENAMQELWEMNGRAKALVDLAKTGAYIHNNEIVVMLGGEWVEPEADEEDASGEEEAGGETDGQN